MDKRDRPTMGGNSGKGRCLECENSVAGALRRNCGLPMGEFTALVAAEVVVLKDNAGGDAERDIVLLFAWNGSNAW